MAKQQGGMFHSARLKLTVFYLATILVLSMSATAGVRIFAEQEFLRSNSVQRGEVYHISKLYLFAKKPPRAPESLFSSVQNDQAALVRQHLNQALVAINLVALFVGGALSYWYAGRTLRPIEQAHEAQKRFASDASHELRTPLTNMQLENEVFLRQKNFTEDEARAQLRSNLEEVQRLEKLSSNLLALTQYGQAALAIAKLPASRLIETAIQHSRKTAKVKKVKFVQQIKPGKVSGHEASLTQLLEILLDNAIKYGPKNGTVTITGQPRSGHYALRIADEGPGILPTDLPHIFDRLYRGDKARSSKEGGYGLGLALAKQIAIANATTIKVESKPGKGTVFEVQLPLAK
ncbi:MAG TPA: HAMP domain-containing sensor histidine kinase [Candidatus Saccharimonadales bacterium]|nr:HAMP domain-containing sensor histidine kinase [Candidatus Saccharimonadales bacterium]